MDSNMMAIKDARENGEDGLDGEDADCALEGHSAHNGPG